MNKAFHIFCNITFQRLTPEITAHCYRSSVTVEAVVRREDPSRERSIADMDWSLLDLKGAKRLGTAAVES